MGFVLYERERFRENTATELTTLADMLGANTFAAPAFNDPKTAQGMLGAQRSEPHVWGLVCMTSREEIFAEYRRPGLPGTAAAAKIGDFNLITALFSEVALLSPRLPQNSGAWRKNSTLTI